MSRRAELSLVDSWSGVARTQTVVHSGAWALAQTLKSSGGGWDLDANQDRLMTTVARLARIAEKNS